MEDENGTSNDIALRDTQSFTLKIENKGIGTMRSTGTYIGLLLQMEEPAFRVSILSATMKALDITPEEVADDFYRTTCTKCAMSDSPMRPCECHSRYHEARSHS